MSQIFIHPGFGGSATTTLQEHLFNEYTEIYSIGRPYKKKKTIICYVQVFLEI
jgi:hypothetical protein